MKVLSKKINIQIFFCLLIILIGCKKNEINDTISGNSEFRVNDIPNNVENEVSIISHEYFDDIDNKSSINVVANCGLITGLNYIGEINLNSLTLQYDPILKRYLGLTPIQNNSTFSIQNSALQHSVPAIGYLNVKSNIPSTDIFNKNNNLILQWTPSGSSENIKIAICEIGSPCIVKTVNESDGNITINSSEFNNFQVGNLVSIYLALNKEYYFSNTSSTINTAITSSSNRYVIQ